MKVVILMLWLVLSILPVCAYDGEFQDHIYLHTDPESGLKTYVYCPDYSKEKTSVKLRLPIIDVSKDVHGEILNLPAKTLEQKPSKLRRFCDFIRHKVDEHPHIWKSAKFTGKASLWACQIVSAVR